VSIHQYLGYTEILGASTTLSKNETIRNQTSLALPRLASSDGLPSSSRLILKKSIKGFERSFSMCRLAIRTIQKRGFPKRFQGRYSRYTKTAESVIVLNIPSRNTPPLNTIRTRTKKSLNLPVTRHFARRGSTAGVAVYRTVIDMLDSFYPKLVGVPVNISDNKLPLRRINRIACANDHR